ncbi:MAG: hypothetical protein HQL27_07665 [Candidatus Omnitrophica bacterium]|nr:hypothetical protein [Candidatus Omnitrophota bacterium]
MKSIYSNSLILAGLLLFMMIHARVLNGAGLTPHPILGKFAKIINEDQSSGYLIGVGSHDIHEKEFQVYFEKNVEKAAMSFDKGTEHLLRHLFDKDEKVYCLILDKEFDNILKPIYADKIKVIQEEFISRRRVSLDKGFVTGLLTFDKSIVRGYLKQKIYLVRKDLNGG